MEMIEALIGRIVRAVRIEDVVRYYTQLYRASKSGKTLECFCPFHSDKNETFKVRVTEQIFECSTCKKKGNVVDFIQNIEGCNQYEALELLVDWYNLKRTGIKSIQKKKNKKLADKSQMLSVHTLHQNKMILNSLTPCTANNSLLVETYKQFEVGIAPDLLPGSYQYFSGRRIFPVRNENEELSAFISYRINEEGVSQYCELPVGEMSTLIYGLCQAIDSIERCGFAYLVNDYEDVLVMHAVGFRNTVACYGDTITRLQAKILLKYTDQVVILHNNDISSQVAGVKMAACLSYVTIQPGQISYSWKGPLSTIIEKMGKDAFVNYIRQSTRLSNLEIYKQDLIDQINSISVKPEQMLTIAERAALRSLQISYRAKLIKINRILSSYQT